MYVHVCSIGFLFILKSGSIKVFHMATKVIFNTSVKKKIYMWVQMIIFIFIMVEADVSVLTLFLKMHLPFPLMASGKALFSKVTRYLLLVWSVLKM